MTFADRTIAALRSEHDTLAAVVAPLTDEQLTGPSGASEWTIADVLSHLGSGAEITAAGIDGATGGEAPGDGFNQSVWDRWNAMTPRGQADGFVTGNAALTERFEAFDGDQRENLRLAVGFGPGPLTVAAFAGLRLDELALHAWDVRVGVDSAAVLDDATATVLLEQFAGDLGFLLGFIGKPDQLASPVVVDIEGTGFALVVGDGVAVTTGATDPTATLTGGADAAIRLLTGRLGAGHTPAAVGVTGATTLGALRAAFPGF